MSEDKPWAIRVLRNRTRGIRAEAETSLSTQASLFESLGAKVTVVAVVKTVSPPPGRKRPRPASTARPAQHALGLSQDLASPAAPAQSPIEASGSSLRAVRQRPKPRVDLSTKVLTGTRSPRNVGCLSTGLSTPPRTTLQHLMPMLLCGHSRLSHKSCEFGASLLSKEPCRTNLHPRSRLLFMWEQTVSCKRLQP